MGKSSRDKGKVGERELSKVLTKAFGIPCRRGVQYSGIGGADVVGIPGVHIECKRTEKLNLHKAYAQAVEDAKDGEVPIVCHRRSREPWMVTFALGDIVALFTAIDGVKEDV